MTTDYKSYTGWWLTLNKKTNEYLLTCRGDFKDIKNTIIFYKNDPYGSDEGHLTYSSEIDPYVKNQYKLIGITSVLPPTATPKELKAKLIFISK